MGGAHPFVSSSRIYPLVGGKQAGRRRRHPFSYTCSSVSSGRLGQGGSMPSVSVASKQPTGGDVVHVIPCGFGPYRRASRVAVGAGRSVSPSSFVR